MNRKPKGSEKKKRTQSAMRDKYWRKVLSMVEKESWEELCSYVGKHPWLAVSAMSRSILPDYLAGEKDYGLLRLLCNVEKVPPEVIQYIIDRGARDTLGRAYLERLLVGNGDDSDAIDSQSEETADSPLVAAKVLRTCERPAEVIEKMQDILEQGLQDEDSARRKLAERCIARSQVFYDILMILYEHDAQAELERCLECEPLMLMAAGGTIESYDAIEAALSDNKIH